MSVHCSLYSVHIGHLHAKRLAGDGDSIRWELRGCYGATLCMGDKDPVVGNVAVTWDEKNLRICKITVEVSGDYPYLNYRDVLTDVPKLISMAQENLARV